MEIKLCDRTREDVEVFWRRMQDPEIQRFFPTGQQTLEEALALFEQACGPEARSFGRVIMAQDTYIGDVWCYAIEQGEERHAMFSIVLFDPAWWGQGLAAKATRLFLPEVQERFDVIRIGAFVYADHSRCIGLLRKLGFAERERFVEEGRASLYLEKRLDGLG